MESDVAGARLGEIGNDAIDRLDHQMHIDIGGDAMIAQSFTHQRADGQVRHIMIIHHIEMNDIRARGDDVIDFFTQTGEIGGQDRRCNQKIRHG